MASFVAEVLSSAGQMEREEINEKLSMLGRRMEELKMEIHTATSGAAATFTTFEPSFDLTATLADKVKAISDEMQNLSDKIETDIKGQLNISTGEFQSLTRQLEQVTLVMSVLGKLTKAQQLMENIATATSNGEYSEASSSLMMLEEAFEKPACEREEEVKILVAVRIQTEVLKQTLIQNLSDAWKETVSWTCLDAPPGPGDKTERRDMATEEEEAKQWELKLPKEDSSSEQQALKEVVTALNASGQLDRKIATFGRQLYQNIFRLVFHWQRVVVKETPLTHGKKVLIKVESEQKQPGCVEAFSIIGNILRLLNDSLLHIEVDQKEVEGHTAKVTLMSLLGDQIAEKVLEGIVKECLSYEIPSTNKELESFHEIVATTQKFQNELVSLGFVSSSSRTLLDYVQNVNVLFANKKCQNILEKARSLMTTDIHDTVQISSDVSAGELSPLDKSGNPSREKQRKMDVTSDPLLSNATFRMPTCRISVCAQDLLNLAYETLNDASSSSPQCAVQMFYAVRNIFELFCSVFPTYHSHSLANFPQLTALHHNNCMYLAHHLLTLGHQFKHSLPSDVSATFVDLIPEVRGLGTASFLEQMNMQKGILEQYLQGADGFVSVDEEANYATAERAVKQSLHQMTHLQKVWQEVLPSSVYRKAIGILFNSLITQVMDSITALEDISSESARKLFTLLKLIDEKGTLLFLTDKEDSENKSTSNKAKVDLHRHVPKYAKFTEIQGVLNGSLQEIADRWAEGMGPLAAEFPANELKQLIRALFQNTDRRAAVLAKIK